MLRMWQPFSCCSTLSTASELHLWALAQKMQQYTHPDLVCSLCPGRVSHPFDILVVLKHLEEPHDQPRCSDHQHLKVHICRFLCPLPHRRVRRIRRPRECALCAFFIPPHSLLAFPLAALQSTLVVLESQAQHVLPGVCCLDCNHILYLTNAYLIDSGNTHRGSLKMLVNRYPSRHLLKMEQNWGFSWFSSKSSN